MEVFFNSASGIWLVIMVVMLIIEAIIPGLVTIWFALGALVSMICAFAGTPLWLQTLLFVLVSFVTLILTRPLAQKYVMNKAQPTNADMIIGKECIVKEEINNILGSGTVVAGGKTWTAVSFDDDTVIMPGTRAVVTEIRGVKAVVKPLENK